MNKIILSVLLIIASSFAAAAIVDADFDTGAGLGHHFATDIYFNSDMSCSYSGTVLEGTPCDDPSAAVCPGGTMYVVPSTSSRWADDYLTVVSSYPRCTGTGYCPTMIDYSSVSLDKPVSWISDSMHSDYMTYISTIPLRTGLEGIERYDELGTFHTQSVAYQNITGGPIYPNKRGEVNVFCNGNVQVIANSAVIATQEIDSPSIEVVPLSLGVNTVRTRLSGVDCFAAVAKNPLDLAYPDYFQILLYGDNRPSVPTVSSNSVTIRVEDRMPSLSLEGVSVTEFGANYIFEVDVRNDGDVPVRITRVVPGGSGFTSPLSPSACFTYGIPTPPCPSSSGFGTTIAEGATHTVYVYYGGTLSGVPITLIYEPLEPICSSETEFELDVALESDIVRCEIEPPTLEAGQHEVHEYEVTCYNVMGDAVPCSGNDWYWADGLSGGFIDRTNTYAWAYTSSSAGSTGTLNYRTGDVICSSDVISSEISPYFDCELDPTSADLEIGDDQYFDLTCYMDGVETPPTDATYDNVDGLVGSITESSLTGTRFTGTVTSDGNLRAFARRSHHGDPTLLGAVAFAHINVGNATETPETPGTGEDEDCEIRPGTDDLYPHDGSTVALYCGEEGARTLCTVSDVEWILTSDLYGTKVTETSNSLAYVVGSTGTPAYGYYTSAITAILNPGTDEAGSCTADINIVEPTCLEYT